MKGLQRRIKQKGRKRRVAFQFFEMVEAKEFEPGLGQRLCIAGEQISKDVDFGWDPLEEGENLVFDAEEADEVDPAHQGKGRSPFSLEGQGQAFIVNVDLDGGAFDMGFEGFESGEDSIGFFLVNLPFKFVVGW